MIEIWAGPLARERADPAGRSAGVSGRSLRKAIKKHAFTVLYDRKAHSENDISDI